MLCKIKTVIRIKERYRKTSLNMQSTSMHNQQRWRFTEFKHKKNWRTQLQVAFTRPCSCSEVAITRGRQAWEEAASPLQSIQSCAMRSASHTTRPSTLPPSFSRSAATRSRFANAQPLKPFRKSDIYTLYSLCKSVNWTKHVYKHGVYRIALQVKGVSKYVSFVEIQN